MIYALTSRARRGDILGTLAQAFDLVLLWHDRSVQRHHLAALDDHVLKDIGLSRADVVRESSKPFWRP